jgi:prevent-host-death family protein
MLIVGTFEARSQLPCFLARVAKGERILITRRARPLAMLVPPEPTAHGDVEQFVKEMLAARDLEGPTRGKNLTIRRMKEEGKRF